MANPTIKKLERRVEKLEAVLTNIIEVYNEAGSIHSPKAMNSMIAKAMTLMGMDKDTSSPCPFCHQPFKTCGHF